MMRLLLVLVVIYSCFSVSAKEHENSSKIPLGFKKLMSQHYVAGSFHGGVLYSDSSGNTYRLALGIANPDTGESLNEEHRFAVNSMGKMFTAVLIMQLVEEGKIKLSDNIKTLVPEFKHPRSGDISIHLLLSHRSGLPDYFLSQLRGVISFGLTQQEVLDEISKMPMDFEPDKAFQYSNTGYILLGEIVRRYRKGNFEDILKTHIFNKLGMNESSITNVEKSIRYFREDGTTSDYEYENDLVGDGQGSSSLMDMYRFLSSLNSPKLLSKQSWDLMFTEHSLPSEVPKGAWPPPHQDPYGYGFGIMSLDVDGKKVRIAGHGGAGNGSNYAGRFLDSDKVIVIYNNMMKNPVLPDVFEYVAQQ